ncbi:MAG: DHHA1 domain-containing protein [Candidatus Parvarchaeota archaeon]|nr:DHHA1 domain-containing protein [Candidatus Parvarchaeota archaeon]
MEEIRDRKEAKEVLDFIKNNDNFSIFYHLDSDGIISAVILSEAIEKLGKSVYAFRVSNYEDFEKGIDMSYFSDNVILCDMQPTKDFIERLSSRKLCVIDHHEVIDQGSSVYINPKMWGDNTYTPCSLLMYKLFDDIVPELDWVAAIGLIGDSGGKVNGSFIKGVAKKYSVKLKDDEYLSDNDFGLASNMINSMTLEYGRSGAEEAVGIIKSSNSLKGLLENHRLISASTNANKELGLLREYFENRKELYDELVYFLDVDPTKKRYSSTLITPVSLEKGYYGKIIVFMTKINSHTLRVNIRANGVNIKLPQVLRETFKNIRGTGGGHDMAAAAAIRPQDENKFKSLFLEEAKKNINQNSEIRHP